jgi:hypothetical protein
MGDAPNGTGIRGVLVRGGFDEFFAVLCSSAVSGANIAAASDMADTQHVREPLRSLELTAIR